MTDIDRVISRSQPFLQSSVSEDKSRSIAEEVLKLDDYTCVECGRSSDDCKLVIRYDKSPSEFNTPSQAMNVDNLETVCESDLLEDDEVAAETSTDESLSTGISSFKGRFEKFLLESDLQNLLSENKYKISILTVLLFILWSYLADTVVGEFVTTYSIFTLPIIGGILAFYYLARYYKPEYEPYDKYNRLILIVGVMVGVIGLIAPAVYLMDVLQLRNLWVDEIGVIGSIAQLIGAYSMSRLVREDKAELIHNNLIDSGDTYSGSEAEKIFAAADYEDTLEDEKIGTMKWRVSAFTTSVLSFIVATTFIPTETVFLNEIVFGVTLLIASLVQIVYLIYRFIRL